MGSTFPRVKTWTDLEDLLNEDLNAEFDNILDNLGPTGVDDYSTNVAQMQLTVDPGVESSESLATSLAGELERLRFKLDQIIGGDNWYSNVPLNLTEANNLVGSGNVSPSNRIVSGRSRSTSNQGLFLVPDGTTRTVTLKATTTDFVVRINNTEVTFTSDIDLTALTAAPSTNNTATLSADITKTQGEGTTTIGISGAGSEITSRVGEIAAFKLDNTVDIEYFIGRIDSSSLLSKASRGYFFDSLDAPIPRITGSSGNTLTLMLLSWIFANDDGATLEVTYNQPVYSKDEPSSPNIGDMWFDQENQTWKKYSGVSFDVSDTHFIGVCIQDSTSTVAARSNEFFANYSDLNTIILALEDVDTVRTKKIEQTISVAGVIFRYRYDSLRWEMPGDLDSGLSELADTNYYCYITELGEVVLSDVTPFDRRGDLRGFYHPFHTWRSVGFAENDSGSDFIAVTTQTNLVDSEQLADDIITTSKIRDDAVTPVKTAPTRNASAGAGVFSTTSAAFVFITGTSVAITSTGNPIMITLKNRDGSTGSDIHSSGGPGTSSITVQIKRDSTVVAIYNIASSSPGITVPTSSVFTIDEPAAGSFTYTAEGKANSGTGETLTLLNYRLEVIEH